jgi:hypothetical protein
MSFSFKKPLLWIIIQTAQKLYHSHYDEELRPSGSQRQITERKTPLQSPLALRGQQLQAAIHK